MRNDTTNILRKELKTNSDIFEMIDLIKVHEQVLILKLLILSKYDIVGLI